MICLQTNRQLIVKYSNIFIAKEELHVDYLRSKLRLRRRKMLQAAGGVTLGMCSEYLALMAFIA